MNIAVLLMAIIGGAAGFLSTFYIVVAMPGLFIWKLYRKVKYNIPLYD